MFYIGVRGLLFILVLGGYLLVMVYFILVLGGLSLEKCYGIFYIGVMGPLFRQV